MDVCAICLEDMETGKTTSFEGCDHVVHSKCFFDYANTVLNTNASHRTVSCPICRNAIITIRPVPAPPPVSISTSNVGPHLMAANLFEVFPYHRRHEEAIPVVTRDDESKIRKGVFWVMSLVIGLNILYLLNHSATNP